MYQILFTPKPKKYLITNLFKEHSLSYVLYIGKMKKSILLLFVILLSAYSCSSTINRPLYAKSDNAKELIQSKYGKPSMVENFEESQTFVNQVSHIAEQENHHPDISFGWGYAKINITTHAIEGLCENDFILAAKIDKIINV